MVLRTRPSSHVRFSNAECPLQRKPQRNSLPSLTMLRVIRGRSVWIVMPESQVQILEECCDESYSEPFDLEDMQGPSEALHLCKHMLRSGGDPLGWNHLAEMITDLTWMEINSLAGYFSVITDVVFSFEPSPPHNSQRIDTSTDSTNNTTKTTYTNTYYHILTHNNTC